MHGQREGKKKSKHKAREMMIITPCLSSFFSLLVFDPLHGVDDLVDEFQGDTGYNTLCFRERPLQRAQCYPCFLC